MKNILLFIAILLSPNIYALNIPTHSSPADGAVSIHTDVTLWINKVTGGTYYDYMLDTVATFDSPVLREYTHTDAYSGWVPNDLYFNKTYYWKIRARNATDTSLWSSVWSFTTITYGATPNSPANGSTELNLKLTLWINDLGAESFDYQLDTVSTFDSPDLKEFTHTDVYSGWTVSDLRYGQKYYWRVRGRNDTDTSAWTSTWNFTTKSYGVTLQSPYNNTTGIDPKISLFINRVTGSENYDYQLDTVSDFDSPELKEFTHTDVYSGWTVSDLRYEQKYYWRARGRNDTDTSGWTSIWNFTTKFYGATPYSPANGSESISLNTTLWLNKVTGSENYDYQIDTSLNFNSPLLAEYTHSDLYSGMNITLTRYGQKYYWRVRGRNDTDTSRWSSAWNLTTVYELTESPVLISPTNGSAGISYSSVLLDWNSITNAGSYQYEISTVNDFSVIYKRGTTSLTDYTISDLQPNTVYYWRVRGENTNGYSLWSEVWNFTTETAVLTAPILVSPVNNSTNIDFNSVDFLWNSVFGANSYNFEISQDNNFITGVTNLSLSDTSVNLAGLNEDVVYYWRVASTDGITTSNWSDIWNFMTKTLTGTKNTESSDIKIYPIPADNFLTISGIKDNAEITVYDISGNKILNRKISSDVKNIRISDLRSGFYILKIIYKDSVFIKNFTIKH